MAADEWVCLVQSIFSFRESHPPVDVWGLDTEIAIFDESDIAKGMQLAEAQEDSFCCMHTSVLSSVSFSYPIIFVVLANVSYFALLFLVIDIVGVVACSLIQVTHCYSYGCIGRVYFK